MIHRTATQWGKWRGARGEELRGWNKGQRVMVQ